MVWPVSYVSIWKPVNDRIVQASRETGNEIIGLLLGKLEDDTIIIEDSITGDYFAEEHRVTLPAATLAKIADGIVTGRIKGNIVGWYHSHTKDGLFFSETDIQTQKQLQQFSSLVTGMVVDANTGEVGYYRIDPQTANSIRLSDDRVRIYKEASEAIPSRVIARTRVRPTPTIEIREHATQRGTPTRKVVIGTVLITLAASAILLGALFLRGPTEAEKLNVILAPVSSATVGTPIEIKANVTGQVRNVTLVYATSGASFKSMDISPRLPGEYAYVISGQEVTGNIAYYIKAIDTSGNVVRTDLMHIPVSDYLIVARTAELTVYRNRSATAHLALLPINGFSQSVTLSASAPQGLTLTFTPNPVLGGTLELTMNAVASDDMPNGTFPLSITATYSPPEAPRVTRQTTIAITIADFDLQASPTSKQVSRGTTSVAYTLTLTIQQGFVDPITVTVSGIPPGARYQLTTTSTTMLASGAGSRTIMLQITLTPSVKLGNYTLSISATGGTIVHTETVELIVR